jgi:hypothetical protein
MRTLGAPRRVEHLLAQTRSRCSLGVCPACLSPPGGRGALAVNDAARSASLRIN